MAGCFRLTEVIVAVGLLFATEGERGGSSTTLVQEKKRFSLRRGKGKNKDRGERRSRIYT